MGAELDARLASAFGVELETAAWLPEGDAEPGELLRAAEAIGEAIGDRRASLLVATERAWMGLPARPEARPGREDRGAAIARVLAWARAGGAAADGIEFHVDARGSASARACRVLSPGERILTLPRRLMIIDNEVGVSALRPRDALAAWLPLAVRDPASPWRAYLDALPVALAELPMFHGDLAALAGTAAHAIAAEDTRDVREAYDALSPELRARVSLADFAWGCAIVQSRGFHAPGTLEHRIALLPLVDLLDHRPGDVTWTYDPLDGDLVVSTERGFAIGDEVHFTYGDQSNARLFVHFGFTLPDNPADEADLVFDPAPDPVSAIAAHLLWQLPLAGPARARIACVLDHRFRRALSLARLHASGPAERARALEAGLAASGDLPWLGGELEAAAFSAMAAAARRALGELDAHAPGEPKSAWERSCAIVRDGERRVLEQILELASAVPAHLHVRDPEQLRAAAAAIPGDARGSRRLLRQYLDALADELTG